MTRNGPLRVATDSSCQRADLPLVPFLHGAVRDVGDAEHGSSWEQRFVGWWRAADVHVSVVDVAGLTSERARAEIAACDAVVVPVDWYWVRGPSWATRPNRELAARCRTLHDLAIAAGRPSIVFFTGDRSCDRTGLDGATVFREGPFRSRMTALDGVLPAFAEDLTAHFCGGEIEERPWVEEPTIGFCGLAGRRAGWKALARLAAFRAVVAWREHRIDPSPYTGENLRAEALDRLRTEPGIRTNFVIRTSSVFFTDKPSGDLLDVRTEYVRNLVDSDYVLCARGSGNYSYRLYEALCVGRVPIVFDTDVAMPCADEIDWKRHCVWVPAGQEHRVGELVRAFHASLDHDRFVALQHDARRLWVERLAPAGWFAHVAATTPRHR